MFYNVIMYVEDKIKSIYLDKDFSSRSKTYAGWVYIGKNISR